MYECLCVCRQTSCSFSLILMKHTTSVCNICKKTVEQIFEILILKFVGKFLKFYIWT